MSPIRDSSVALFVLSDAEIWGASLTAEKKVALEIDGTKLGGMAVVLAIPAVTGTTAVSLKIFASSTTTITTVSGTYEIIAERTEMATAAGEYVVPFSTRKRTVYFDFEWTAASGCISNPQAWVTLDYNQDWTRLVEFR